MKTSKTAKKVPTEKPIKQDRARLAAIAAQPRPSSYTLAYHRWWGARRALGLPTSPAGVTLRNPREYMRQYMAERRKQRKAEKAGKEGAK